MGTEKLKLAIAQAKKIIFENAKVKEAWEKIKTINSFKAFMNAFSAFWVLLKAVALAVEIVQVEYKLCTEAERIDVAAGLLDEIIEFKNWFAIFEPFDEMLFRLLISSAVQSLNDKLGKKWLSKLTATKQLDRDAELMLNT